MGNCSKGRLMCKACGKVPYEVKLACGCVYCTECAWNRIHDANAGNMPFECLSCHRIVPQEALETRVRVSRAMQ